MLALLPLPPAILGAALRFVNSRGSGPQGLAGDLRYAISAAPSEIQESLRHG
jgi:hypothetical protein